MIVFTATTAEDMRTELLRYLDHLSAIEERAKGLATGKTAQARQARINLLTSCRMELKQALIQKGESNG